MGLFGPKKNPVSSSPPPNPIAITRLEEATKANDATATRALANVGSTATAGVGGISAAVTVAASMAGVAGLIPPLAPAALAVIIGCLFIIRQKGLNEELASNLYFIKMEVERMSRIHNVMKEIAKEAKINLNTASLAIIMDSLKDKILQFADNDTKMKMKEFENLLKTDILQAKQIATNITSEVNNVITYIGKNTVNGILAPRKKLSFWLPKGWVSRWLSPSETLRQIIRDITIANVWFSIMLGEFHIFIQYLPATTKNWKGSEAMKELLNANYMLGTTTSLNKSIEGFDLFYNLQDTGLALGELTEDPNNPAGGRRKTRRYKKKRQSKYTRKN